MWSWLTEVFFFASVLKVFFFFFFPSALRRETPYSRKFSRDNCSLHHTSLQPFAEIILEDLNVGSKNPICS